MDIQPARAARARLSYAARILTSLLLLWGIACVPAHAQRLVFAHYMVTNQDYQGNTDPTQEAKIAAYEKEIQQAQAAGIDGFALNVGGWLNQNYYIIYSAQIFEAAVRLNSGFKLMFSADMCCGNGLGDVEDMVRRFANDPRYSQVYFKFNGEFVLTTFSGDNMGTSFWQQVRSDLATGGNPSTTSEPNALAEVSGPPSNAPVNIFLVPAFFWGGEIPTLSSVQQGFSQWSSTIDGSFYWGIAGVPGSGGSLDQIPSSDDYASVVHSGGKLYMAPICLQFWGANADRYYEYSGAAGMRKMWMDAINVSHPDWVEIITWNDFIEGSYVSPIDDPNKYPFANFLDTTGVPSSTLGYFHSHQGATALLPYFIQWYKTGVQPTISNDSIYWFYRTQSMNFNAGTPAVSPGTNYGPMADVIYVTANLPAPAVLKVTSGSQVSTFNLSAGSSDVQAPFTVGTTPTFELDRGGVAVIPATSGTDAISAAPQYNDYYYSTGFVNGAPFNAPPSAPTGLSATGGNHVVTLSWQASVGSAPITYNVFRGPAASAEGSTPIATGITGTSFSDTGVTNGSTYFYVVDAVNNLGISGGSNEVSATPAAPTPPSVPTGLSATGGVSQVSLSWSASTGTAPITYSVFRGTTAGGEGATAVATGLKSASFTDAGLATGTTYYYKVSATNAAATTALSSEASATTLTAVLQINAGGGAVAPFIADAGFSGGNEFSSSATIDTSGVASPAPQAVYQDVRWAPSLTYTITGLTAGASYLVRLHFCELSFTAAGQRVFNVAINGTNVLSNFDIFATAGAQNKATIKEATSTADSSGRITIAFSQGSADNPEIAALEIYGTGSSGPPAIPATPTGLAATAGSAQVLLSWNASARATSYSIYRSTTSNGEGTSALSSGVTGTSFTDTGLANGTTYFYKVASVNSAGTSAQSTEVSATPTGSTGTGLPDLVVSSLTWSPANPNAGDHVVFTVVVTNQGTVATPAGTILGVGFYLDGNTAGANLWEDTDTTSLAPGASVTLTATGGTAGVNYWIATAGSHTMTAWVDDVNRIAESNENNNKLTQTLSVGSSTALTPVVQIDSGSGSAVAPFSADVDFNTGNEFSNGAAIDVSAAANPAPAAVYQTCRWAPSFSYVIPGLQAGASYTVRLHFAELTWTSAGQRTFNVAINGTNVLSGFDVFAAAGGANKAITEQFTATASSSGQITIAFTQGGADNPMVSGIEILH
jgi:glucan endo-1,3-alpha-glucosidase